MRAGKKPASDVVLTAWLVWQLREGLPPEGYWSDMAEQIKGKADKKVGQRLAMRSLRTDTLQ